jgi:5-methylcytosine-specific restriction endonuclease McrA
MRISQMKDHIERPFSDLTLEERNALIRAAHAERDEAIRSMFARLGGLVRKKHDPSQSRTNQCTRKDTSCAPIPAPLQVQ